MVILVSKKHTILVTGAGGPAGINTIRGLRRYYRIIATDMSEYSEGFIFSDKHYIIHPAKDKRFLQDIDRIIYEEGINLGILTVDEEIEVISRFYKKYKEIFILHPPRTVGICLDKYLTYKYFSGKIPEIVPEFSLDPLELKSGIIIKKPRKGRGSIDVELGSKESMVKEEGFVYMEYLPGKEWTVDIITGKDGEALAIVPRIRIKTRGGVSVIGKVKLDEKIIDYSKRILKELEFSGALNIQFREDKDGKPKLQEINPRFSGGLDITIAAGANLPQILVDLWLFGRKPKEVRVREGIYYKVWNVISFKI